MSINIPALMLDFKGQCVNRINCDPATNTLAIICQRDKRYSPIDADKKRGTRRRA